jgi:hypothetical protein
MTATPARLRRLAQLARKNEYAYRPDRDDTAAALDEYADLLERPSHEPEAAPSSIVRCGDAFVETFKREPKTPSDSAWMNGYEAALRAAQPPDDGPCWCPYCGEPHGVHRDAARHAAALSKTKLGAP